MEGSRERISFKSRRRRNFSIHSCGCGCLSLRLFISKIKFLDKKNFFSTNFDTNVLLMMTRNNGCWRDDVRQGDLGRYCDALEEIKFDALIASLKLFFPFSSLQLNSPWCRWSINFGPRQSTFAESQRRSIYWRLLNGWAALSEWALSRGNSAHHALHTPRRCTSKRSRQRCGCWWRRQLR